MVHCALYRHLTGSYVHSVKLRNFSPRLECRSHDSTWTLSPSSYILRTSLQISPTYENMHLQIKQGWQRAHCIRTSYKSKFGGLSIFDTGMGSRVSPAIDFRNYCNINISAPEPTAQVHLCVVRCLSSVVVYLTFHIFDFPLKLQVRIQRNLSGSKISTSSAKLVFFGPVGKQDDRPASDWLRHFRLLLWNHWTEIQRNLTESKITTSFTSLCFSDRSEKQDRRPGLWLAETFSTCPLKPLNGIHRNLTGSKITTSFTKFVFFGPVGKTRSPPRSLIGADISDFSSETVERNSRKHDRKQDHNVLYHVCVFFGPIGKTRWLPWPIRQKSCALYPGARYVPYVLFRSLVSLNGGKFPLSLRKKKMDGTPHHGLRVWCGVYSPCFWGIPSSTEKL